MVLCLERGLRRPVLGVYRTDETRNCEREEAVTLHGERAVRNFTTGEFSIGVSSPGPERAAIAGLGCAIVADKLASSPCTRRSGRVTDWSGAPLVVGGKQNVIACADPRLHAQAVAGLAG
jgi:hypothetical protein